MHHVPQTADLPNTVHLHAGSSIQFIPTNYFETGIQRETVNMIRINYDGTENGTEVETFGAHEDTCALQYEPQDVDLWGYRGDSVVRKFPFSPDEYYKTHPAD
jgi:primary-amine oxidase